MEKKDKKQTYYEVVIRKDGKERVVGIYNEDEFKIVKDKYLNFENYEDK